MKNNVGTANQINRDLWIKQKLKNIKNGKILDAGAGECRYKKFCSHLDYYSQDFCKYSGVGDKSALQTGKWNTAEVDIVSDVTKIPVDDYSFDVVLCTEVLEHISNPINAIKEFRRVLKVGGKLILTAPFASLTHFSPYYFYSGFSVYWYKNILNDAGFRIKEIKYNGNYFEYLAQELRRLEDVGSKYSKEQKIGFFYKFSKNILLKYLKNWSKNDRGSNEFLCFGIHILAEKK